MRLRATAGAFVVATMLAGSCFGQGLGDVAERDRRRRAASKPPAVGELVPGTTRWAGTRRVQGQTHPLGLVTEVRDAGSTWIVRESWRYTVSLATESSELAKGSMHRLRHWSRHGSHWMEYEVREGRVAGRRGTDAFGPFEASSSPLSIEVEAPLFAGAGVPQVVASLPLTQGFETRIWDLDLGMRRAVRKTLTVVDQERVTVPAGTFLAWRVAIVADEPYVRSMTVWVGVESRQAVRLDSPSVGGQAAYTMELQP
jgi:hypothetical protein